MDLLPAPFLLAGSCSVSLVPPPISASSGESIPLRQTALLRLSRISSPISHFCSTLGASKTLPVGGLRQAAIRRTRAGSRLRGPLYPPRSDLQPPPSGYRERSSSLPMEGLPKRRPK